MITYEIKKGKYVFCKDGVYFSLTLKQMSEMQDILNVIMQEEVEKILMVDDNAS